MTSDEIRQKAREYRKQFYAPGTQHVNDSAIDQENMLTGFAVSLLFPASSGRDVKELAGRIARVIEERWNEISNDPAVTLTGVIEQELTR